MGYVPAVANPKIYIHELIEITGQNRARYMHHMTANWGPIGREERNLLCVGVWGTVGSTERWPETVNLWEIDGWSGLAANFRHEFSHPTLQDPALATWWAEAQEAFDDDAEVARWRQRGQGLVLDWRGKLLVDSPLNPLKTGKIL